MLAKVAGSYDLGQVVAMIRTISILREDASVPEEMVRQVSSKKMISEFVAGK